MVCTLYQIYESDQVKNNEMGKTRGTYGTEERYIHGFRDRNLKKRPFVRPRPKWGNNIKMYIKSFGKAWTK